MVVALRTEAIRMLSHEPSGELTATGRIDVIDYIDILASGPHDPSTSVPKGAILTVSGWALIEDNPAIATGLYVSVDGGTPLEGVYGLERNDIAEAFGNDLFAATGFRAVVSTAHLDPGSHDISLHVRDGDGRLVPVAGGEGSFRIDSSLERLVLDTPSSPEPTAFSIDTYNVDGVLADEPLAAGPNSVIGVRGWAVDRPAGALASAVFGIIGSTVVKAVYGFPRPDVVDDQGNDAYYDSGFALEIPLDDVVPGEHALTIRVVGADGATVYDGWTVRVDVATFDIENATLISTGTGTQASIDEVVVFDSKGRVRPQRGSLELEPGDELFVRGWAIDEVNDTVARAVHVCVDDLASTPAIYGVERDDVAEAFARPDLAPSGFTAFVSMSTLAPGPHELELRVVDLVGRGFYETDQRVAFEVVEPN